MAETKICKKCGRELPVTEFYPHKHTKDGLDTYCKECKAQATKERRAHKKAEETPAEDPAEVTPALAAFTDDELLAELKDRGYFWKDLYKYVKVDFESIK